MPLPGPTLSSAPPPRPRRHLPRLRPPRRRAFSLIEMLIAIFILSIGLVILATLFPIAADWTRQSVDHTVAQSIARNAVAMFQQRCMLSDFNDVGQDVTIPTTAITHRFQLSDFTYRYGNSSPMVDGLGEPPPPDAAYYWFPLARRTYGEPEGTVELFICVLKKGDGAQEFPTQIPGDSHMFTLTPFADKHFPTLWGGPYRDGTYVPPPGEIVDPVIFPPIGDYAIGRTSGTVFRQRLLGDASHPAPSTPLVHNGNNNTCEDVLCIPPTVGTNSSPLIYIYQTAVAF